MDKKSIFILAFSIIAVVILLGVSLKIYFNGIIESSTTDITIGNILEYPGGAITVDKFLMGFSSDYNLNASNYNDIKLDPQKYKMIHISYNINNKSKLLGLYDINIEGVFNNAVSNIIIGKINSQQSDDSPQKVKPMEKENSRFQFIVNANGKSDQEILDYVKESKFKLVGKCGFIPIKILIKKQRNNEKNNGDGSY